MAGDEAGVGLWSRVSSWVPGQGVNIAGTCSLEAQTIRPQPRPAEPEVWGPGPSRQRSVFTDLQDCGSSSCMVSLYIIK